MQIVCCAKCRYKYELVSGNIVSVDSEEIRLVYFRMFYFLGCLTFPQEVKNCFYVTRVLNLCSSAK